MKTAVITTGGLGTRLLTYTKANPKTMLPLYDSKYDKTSSQTLRPLLEIIFNNLFEQGFRKFCFIVGGKTKYSIFNHFLPDPNYITLLKKRSTQFDIRFIESLTRLYKKIDTCEIEWISQATPMGFGHALYEARKFVGDDTFLLHAGDAYFPKYDFLAQFVAKQNSCSGILLLQQKKILKGYGIAQIRKVQKENLVINVQEKPKKPITNLVILPIYVFTPIIFDALKHTTKGYNGELQVTDAIKTMIDWKRKVLGFDYGNKPWFDVGTPENYFAALKHSYQYSRK